MVNLDQTTDDQEEAPRKKEWQPTQAEIASTVIQRCTSGQSTVAFHNVRNWTETVESSLPGLSDNVQAIISKNFKKGVDLSTMFKNMLRSIVENSSTDAVYYKLLARIVEAHQLSPQIFIISKLPEFSEMNISLQFWGRIFLLVFSSSPSLIVKSGMKGDFIETILGNKKEHVAHRPLDRLRAPLSCDNEKAVVTFLRQLAYYRDHLETLSYDINQMINENDDRRASFGSTLSTNSFQSPNFLDWIDDSVERL